MWNQTGSFFYTDDPAITTLTPFKLLMSGIYAVGFPYLLGSSNNPFKSKSIASNPS